MIISFDLDETLFVNPEKIPIEKPFRFPLNIIFKDKLRAGAAELLRKINSEGDKLWIYTTSYRSERYIRRYFRHYGIKIDNIINAGRHIREVQGGRAEPMPSKYPSKYHIDLHVDDEISVYQNGIAYGFRVYLLKENDTEWADNICREIECIRRR